MGLLKIGTIALAATTPYNDSANETIENNVEIKNNCIRVNANNKVILKSSNYDKVLGFKPGQYIGSYDNWKTKVGGRDKKYYNKVYYSGYIQGVGSVYDIETKNSDGQKVYNTFLTEASYDFEKEELNQKLFEQSIKQNFNVKFFRKYRYNPLNLPKDKILQVNREANKIFPFKYVMQTYKEHPDLGVFVNLKINEGNGMANGKWYSFLITKKALIKRNFLSSMRNGIFEIKNKKPIRVPLVANIIQDAASSHHTFSRFGLLGAILPFGTSKASIAPFEVNLRIDPSKNEEIVNQYLDNDYYKKQIIRHNQSKIIRFVPLIRVNNQPVNGVIIRIDQVNEINEDKNKEIEIKDTNTFNVMIPGGSEIGSEIGFIKGLLQTAQKTPPMKLTKAGWAIKGALLLASTVPEMLHSDYPSEMSPTKEEKNRIMNQMYLKLGDNQFDASYDTLKIKGEVLFSSRSNKSWWDKSAIEMNGFLAETFINLQIITFKGTENNGNNNY